jgi:hypothetical protein
MDPLTLASLMSALAAAFWTVWTWSADHKEQRQLERDQAAALYVNPYIMIIGELNKRLGGLLEGDDLAQARRDHPGPHQVASPFAVETLYVLGVYFGWGTANLRYGPYTRDPVVLGCLRDILRTFDRRVGRADEAFRLSVPELTAFGASIMRRVGAVGPETPHSHGFMVTRPEFTPMPLHEFQVEFASPDGATAKLYRGPAIRRIVDAIDGADRPAQLKGRERLAALRPVLTRLAQHLQLKEGIVLTAPDTRPEPAAPATTNGSARVAPRPDARAAAAASRGNLRAARGRVARPSPRRRTPARGRS